MAGALLGGQMDAGQGLNIIMINTYKALSMSQAQTTLFVTTTLGGRYHYFSFLTGEELETKADLPTVIERIEPGPELKESDYRTYSHNHTFVSLQNS